MNKKLIFALALPAIMASCSQEDLITENVAVTNPQAKSISGLTFNVAKGESGLESRADWVNNKIQFEKSDLISLYWLGSDGYEQDNTNGVFTDNQITLATTALEGKSNAVYRTEDGSSFTAEAVVYEGYNLLVYPANTAHTTSQAIEVKIPQNQSASKDFTENVIYVGDSIMQIHQPAYKASNGKYYDMYGKQANTDDPNTSGYAHGIKTGVKLLTSLLNLDLQIQNAPANDVKINKVELTTKDGTAIYSVKGNLLAGDESQLGSDSPTLAKYMNPWYSNNDAKSSLNLDFTDVTTNMASTKGTMVLLPVTDTTKQPILKIHTNYGVVTVGGNNAVGTTHTNCIYKADGKTYAAATDDVALQEIVEYATEYEVTSKLWKTSTKKYEVDYTFNSGVSMTRVIKVDMQQANIQGMHVKNTAELNAVLNSAISNTNQTFTTTNPLNVYLDFDGNGNFILTDYVGLDKFVTKFGAGKLSLLSGTRISTGAATSLESVTVNTTDVKVLKNIEGLNSGVKLIIPASSAINSIKNGTSTTRYAITNPIVNKTTLTVPAYANVVLNNNTNAQVNYTVGASIDVTTLTAATYGKIYYKATNKANLDAAAANCVNYILVENITSGFFSGGLDLTSAVAHGKGGVTVEFSNCGNLNETITNSNNVIKTETIVLSNGTSYANMTNATVNNVVVKSAVATLAVPTTASAKQISKVVIENGASVSINNLDITTLEVKNSAVAELGTKALAPVNFFVYGAATFAGDNRQTNGKVFTDTDSDNKIEVNCAGLDKCLVTGTLTLSKDLGYKQVAVSETTKINVVEGVNGLGYNQYVFVTKDSQAKNTTNLKYSGENPIVKVSWNGVSSDITWF